MTDQRGFFGVAVYHPKTAANIGCLWRSATAYGAGFLATIGRRYQQQASDTSTSPLHTPLHHYTDMDDLIGHLPWSCPLVGVELTDTAIPLGTFVHPDRALYLLGAEDHGLPPAVLGRCHHVVRVETVVLWSLNVAVAGSVVLWDRHRKRACGHITR